MQGAQSQRGPCTQRAHRGPSLAKGGSSFQALRSPAVLGFFPQYLTWTSSTALARGG